MKIRTALLLFFAALLFVCLVQLTGCQTPNRTTDVQESWESISNRLGSLSISKIKKSAGRGDSGAQYYLAIVYGDGNRVAKNQGEAFKWMNLAAQQGMAKAQSRLGSMFQGGLGVATNSDEAVVWYQKATDQGDIQAQFNLGTMYENGVGVPQDYIEAAKLYRLAADQGSSLAQYKLGQLYWNGFGVPFDPVETVKWYTKSAEQGLSLAKKNLAGIYSTGIFGLKKTSGEGAEAQIRSGGVAPNYELAEKLMREAVDLNSAEGQYEFGQLLHDECVNMRLQDDASYFHKAAEWYRKAAEQGYAKAQYSLAEMYNYGELGDDQRTNCIPWYLKAGTQGNVAALAEIGQLRDKYPSNDLVMSIDIIGTLRQSAEGGSLDAQYQLANRYQFGHGVPKDAAEAFKWMQMAAQQDQTKSSQVSDAIYNLALMYEQGQGVTNDLSKAHDLFLQAAAGHQSDATFRVGQMYEHGNGVSQDDHTAVEFYSNKIHLYDFPDKYPNGFVDYLHPGDGAIESLFKLWSQGRGFPNDNDKGDPGYREVGDLIKYWEQSINTPKAQFYLGEIYYQGKLVPQDLVEAAARFQVAATHNLDDARKMLDELEPKLSPGQKNAVKYRYNALEEIFEKAEMIQRIKKY